MHVDVNALMYTKPSTNREDKNVQKRELWCPNFVCHQKITIHTFKLLFKAAASLRSLADLIALLHFFKKCGTNTRRCHFVDKNLDRNFYTIALSFRQLVCKMIYENTKYNLMIQ